MSLTFTRTTAWHVRASIVIGLLILAAPAMAADPPESSAPSNTTDPRSLAVPNPEVDPDLEDDGGLAAELEAFNQELRQIAEAYAAPPGAKQLSKLPDLWIDRTAKRVYIDGYVTMRRGPLEMFACPVGSKEHESIVAVFAQSSEVHAALLSIGAQTGTPVQWEPRFVPPTGQEIAVWVMWRDKAGEFQTADARDWLLNTQTNETLDRWWVFAGSKFWTDPADGSQHYTADGGDMICVSNFSTAMLDVPFDSSAQAGSLLFSPFTDRIPEQSTPVRLALVPLPAKAPASATPAPAADPVTTPGTAGDAADASAADRPQPPGEEVLPLKAGARPPSEQ